MQCISSLLSGAFYETIPANYWQSIAKELERLDEDKEISFFSGDSSNTDRLCKCLFQLLYRDGASI